jgi:hypothetical protein
MSVSLSLELVQRGLGGPVALVAGAWRVSAYAEEVASFGFCQGAVEASKSTFGGGELSVEFAAQAD